MSYRKKFYQHDETILEVCQAQKITDEKQIGQVKSFYFIVHWIDKLVPFWFVKLMCMGVGNLLWITNSWVYRVAKKNISLAEDQLNFSSAREKRKFTRKSLYYMLISLYETYVQCAWTTDRYKHRLRRITGPVPIPSKDKPVIQMVMHGISVSYVYVPSLHTPNHIAMVKHHKKKNLYNATMLLRYRDADQKSFAALANTTGVKQLIRNIKKDYAVSSMTIDNNPKHSKHFAEFFGVRSKVTHLVHKLRMISDAELIWCLTTINSDGTYNLHYKHADEGLYSDDLQTHLDAMNRQAERLICNTMREQYPFWAYKRHDSIKYY